MATEPVVVIDIGCLDCHNESNLLGVYETAEKAKEMWPEARLRSEMTSFEDWGGQDVQVIFPLPGVIPCVQVA